MINSDDFDFDTFMQLAQRDPEEFNCRRQALIDANIAAAPEHIQPKLRHLQCRADLVRQSAPNPVAATRKLSTMMWDSVTGPGGLQESLNALADGDPSLISSRPTPAKKAKVVAFPGQQVPK